MDEMNYILKEKSFKCYGFYLLVSFILLPILMVLLKNSMNEALLNSVLNLIGYLILSITLSIFLYKYIILDFKDIKKNLIRCIIILLIAYPLVRFGEYLSTLFYSLFNMELTSNNQESIIKGIEASNFFVSFLPICILAPITEELIFRKCIFSHFKNAWFGVLTSTILFSLIHVLGTLDFIHILPYVITGFLFSLFYKLTNKNIIVNILIHMIINTVSFILIVVNM